MPNTTPRREFLSRTAVTLTGLAITGALAPIARAIEPFHRAGKPELRPSLAAYSFRQFFAEGKKTEPNPSSTRQIDLFQFLDYCADQHCAAELTSYYFPPNPTDNFLLQVKRHAFLRNVAVSGTAVGNSFTHPPGPKRAAEIKSVKDWIDRAAVLGAPHIRVFAGNVQGTSKQEARKLCVEALEECAEYAGRKGIFLGIENHGGIVSDAPDLLDIIRTVKSPWCGLNLDSGNFHTADPYQDLELIAPYAVNVQWKSEILPRGAKEKQPADLHRLVKILRAANYQGYLALEYEAEADAWANVPRLLQEMRAVLAA